MQYRMMLMMMKTLEFFVMDEQLLRYRKNMHDGNQLTQVHLEGRHYCIALYPRDLQNFELNPVVY